MRTSTLSVKTNFRLTSGILYLSRFSWIPTKAESNSVLLCTAYKKIEVFTWGENMMVPGVTYWVRDHWLKRSSFPWHCLLACGVDLSSFRLDLNKSALSTLQENILPSAILNRQKCMELYISFTTIQICVLFSRCVNKSWHMFQQQVVHSEKLWNNHQTNG